MKNTDGREKCRLQNCSLMLRDFAGCLEKVSMFKIEN